MITGEERLRENLTICTATSCSTTAARRRTQIERADAVARELGDVQRISTPGRHGSWRGSMRRFRGKKLEPSR